MAIDDINDNIDDGIDNLNQFGRETSFIIDAFTTLGEVIQRSMGEAISSANDMDDIGRSIANTYKKDILRNIKGVVSGLDTQLAIEQKIAEGADVTAEISKLQEQLEAKKLAIKARMNLLQNSGVALSDEEKAALQEQVQLQEQLISDLQTRNTENAKAAQEAKRASGATGAAVAGFDNILKSFDKSGNLSDRLDLGEASASAEEYAAGILASGGNVNSLGNQFRLLGKLGGGVFKQLLTAFKPIDLIVTGITLIIDAFVKLDESSAEFARNFGISYKQVLPIQKSFYEIAQDSNSIAVTTKGVGEAFVKINNRAGTFGKISEEILTTYADLSARTNLTEEALGNLTDTAILLGKDMEVVTGEIVGQIAALNVANGISINQREAIEETKDISAALFLSLNKNPKALAEAVFQAKQLGVSLQEAEKISSSLLEFQSSIEAELEAELLTGKQLNFEQARLLALQGKSVDAAAEVVKQLGTSADFTNMNVIEQEALAAAAGMTRDQLADSLRQQELIAKIGASNTQAAEAYRDILNQGGTEAEAIAAAQAAGYDELTDTLSVQQKFTMAVAKLQELFVGLAIPILEIAQPFMDLALNILPVIETILSPIVGLIQMIAPAMDEILAGFLIYKGLLISINAIKAVGLARDTASLAMQTEGNTLAGVRSLLEGESLSLKLATYAATLRQIAAEKLSLATEKIRAAFANKNFFKDIGLLAVNAAKAVAGIPIVGPALAVAAAATAYALGKSYFSKGDDVFMPPEGESGYGDRTLLGPEGAIALNNKDTVIAGTNLFPTPEKKANDMVMAPEGEVQVQPNNANQSTIINNKTINNIITTPAGAAMENLKAPLTNAGEVTKENLSNTNITPPPSLSLVPQPQPNTTVLPPAVNTKPSPIVNTNITSPTPSPVTPQSPLNVTVPSFTANTPQSSIGNLEQIGTQFANIVKTLIQPPNLTTPSPLPIAQSTPNISPTSPVNENINIETSPPPTPIETRIETGGGTDTTGLEKQMAKAVQLLESLNNKEGNVLLDGTKVGTTLNIGSYKLQ